MSWAEGSAEAVGLLAFREPMLEAAGSGARGILEPEWLVASGGRAWTARLALLLVLQQRGPHKTGIWSPPYSGSRARYTRAPTISPRDPSAVQAVPSHTHIPHAGLAEAMLNFSSGCHSPDCLWHITAPTLSI